MAMSHPQCVRADGAEKARTAEAWLVGPERRPAIRNRQTASVSFRFPISLRSAPIPVEPRSIESTLAYFGIRQRHDWSTDKREALRDFQITFVRFGQPLTVAIPHIPIILLNINCMTTYFCNAST